MEIGGVGLAGLLGTGVGQMAREPSEVASARLKARSSSEVAQHDRSNTPRSRGKALGMLRQEIRQALSAHFRLRFAAPPAEYLANAAELKPGDVAADTLGAATRLAGRSPLDASQTLADLRQQIEGAAGSVREFSGDADFDDLDEAVARVNDGLDDLDGQAARNTEASVSVLSAESRLKQQSTIRIRTQEGDIVRFDLRFTERVSANDVAVTDGDSTFASTQVEMSSRTRMVLKVNGDLNEAELAAIQNVFTQAESIANEFFDGDLAAAFDMAAGLEYDTEQLARVGMRFREKLVSTVSYAAIGAVAPQAIPEPIPVDAGIIEPAAMAPPEPIVPEQVTEPATAPPDDDAISQFMDLLANFLQSINEGFELDSGALSLRFHFSQSFKLEILKSVLQVSAPEDSGSAADNAVALIDAVAENGTED
ncbi:MAG: hypothetical protein OEM51_10430 [Gammaproteobacteria bacterium]|nr:hypothetical protein [Gammaproteobacteria bacterium]MDH3428992.1 hypothetical protein [Gammaproteobacteria bacterium]